MKVTTLRISNFLSHKHSKVELSDLGVTLIEGENRDRGGSNGAGKTTLIEALYWCLYGQLLRPIKLADLSHNGEGNVSVQADLVLTDGTLVTILRTHSFKGQPPITFTINGTGVECGTVAETQKRINALVRADAKTFKHVVLFSAATESFASLTDKGQKEILDAILGLDRLPKALERVSEKLKDFKIQRLNTDTAVQNCQTETARSQERIRKLDEAEKGFAHTRQMAVKQAKADLLRLMKEEPDLGFDASNDGLEAKRARAKLLGEALGPLKSGGLAAVDALMAAKQERTKLHMALAQAQRSLGNIKLTDPDALVAEKSSCPTCEQALPVSALKALHASYVRKLKQEQEDQQHYQKQISSVQEKIKLADKQVKELEGVYNERNAQLVEHQTLSVEIVRLEAARASLLAEHTRWAERLKQAEQKLEKEKAQKSPYTALLEAEAKELAALEKRYVGLQDEQDYLDEEQRYLDFWKLGFGNQGVKGLILDTVTPYLNEQANYYAKILTAGAAKIEFMTHFRSPTDGDVKEKFDVEAGYTHGAATYDGVSDGERRLLDLACLFALGDLAAGRSGSPLQLRLLDEPFGPLDSVGQERVLKVLNLLAARLGTVLVTSHESGVAALIEKRIIVTKSNGVSRIAQEV